MLDVTQAVVQVFHDITGMYDRLKPKFAKQYTNAADIISQALISYREETEAGKFPSDEHVFKIKKSSYHDFRDAIGLSDYQELHYSLIREAYSYRERTAQCIGRSRISKEEHELYFFAIICQFNIPTYRIDVEVVSL